MNRVSAMLATAALSAIVGCNTGSSPSARQGRPPLPNEKFDLVKEPAINADSRFAAGQLAESRGDWARAAEQYQAALELRPNHADSLNRLGVSYVMMRQYEQAIEATQRYVDVSGGAPQAWNNLGQCYEYANRLTDAAKAYESGIAKDPKSLICRTNYGLLLLRQGRVNEGCEQMEAVLPPAEVRYNVASILELQNRKEEARIEYQKALKLDPNLEDAKKRLAQLDTN
jgi:tetratricopeptide (TPR) repeat protein